MNTILSLISACIKTNDIKIQVREFMKDKCDRYPAHWSLFQKAHHELYLGQCKEEQACPVCGVGLKFLGLTKGYPKNCSYTCRSKNPEYFAKYKETCISKFGTEYASQANVFREAVKASSIARYGVDNPFKSKTVQEEYKKTIQQKYGVDNVSKSKLVLDKIREAHIKTGRWTADSAKSEIELYRAQVSRISAKAYHDYFYRINPDGLERSRYQYHLDHIFSVDEGFKNNIPPAIIGHYTNLRMMWHLDNCIKNTKCHKTKEQLYEDYSNSTM